MVRVMVMVRGWVRVRVRDKVRNRVRDSDVVRV